MNDTLKAAGRIGTELGAAKAENEKLRGLLQQVVDCQAEHYGDGCGLHLSMITLVGRIKDALSQQAEPTDAFTAVDMATAAAQGFRDGQAAVEQAPVQDEREAFEAWGAEEGFVTTRHIMGPEYKDPTLERMWQAWQTRATRPAQTEQQPIAWATEREGDPTFPRLHKDEHQADHWVQVCNVAPPIIKRPLYAAPIAQTAPQGKFRMGDLVRKTSGSEWQGRICGTYSTALTPEGYAVESEAHAGSVQIYPAKALEAVDD